MTRQFLVVVRVAMDESVVALLGDLTINHPEAIVTGAVFYRPNHTGKDYVTAYTMSFIVAAPNAKEAKQFAEHSYVKENCTLEIQVKPAPACTFLSPPK